MEELDSVDPIDQDILRILSAYEFLTPLQVWYELGEDDTVKERPTEEEVSRRLVALATKGSVEAVKEAEGGRDSGLLSYRLKKG